MLRGTPYLLEGGRADGVVSSLRELSEEVELLRVRGALDQRTLGRLRDEWKVEQVYETTGIEGNQLSINETRLVIERGLTISGKPTRDSDEARNMKHALDFLEEVASSDVVLSGHVLREVQSLIIGETTGSGRYRDGDVRIAGSPHVPPPAMSVPAEVDEIFSWFSSAGDCPPPLSAAVVHAWVPHVHPFTDGNGRSARAIMNLILVRAGYPIVLIRRKDRTRYYDALAASDDGDIAPLVDLIAHRSRDSLRQISRVRAAETGLTQAVLKAEQRARGQYEVWRQAMLLLLRSIEESTELVREESAGAIDLHVREYDQVTPEDFTALLNDDHSGNGWLGTLKGRAYGAEAELLLWVGFRSRRFKHAHQREVHGASVFLSKNDPEGPHPFKRLPDNNPMGLSEVAFDGGSYLTLLEDDGPPHIAALGANELAGKLVGAFIETYLASPSAHP